MRKRFSNSDNLITINSVPHSELKKHNLCEPALRLSMLSAVKPPTNKFIPVQYSAINKLAKWQLGVSLSLTSAAALRAAADKLTPLIYPKQQTSKNLTAERIATKHAAADRAFCADPLAKSRFYRRALLSYFLFPFASSFSFFGEAIVARFLAKVNGRKIAA